MRRVIVPSLLLLALFFSSPTHRRLTASVSYGSVNGYRAADHNNYGVNNDWNITGNSVENFSGQAVHAKIRDAGVGWVRYWLSWEASEPTNGNFNWGISEHDINAALDQGMNVYITIYGAPAWAHNSKQTYHWLQCDNTSLPGLQYDPNKQDCGANYAPFDQSNGQSYYWKRFVTAAVKHYGNKVKYWGFWNESGNQVFWPEPAEAPYYSRAKQLVDKVIKPGRDAALAANPNLLIVGPEENDTWWLNEFLKLERDGLPGVPAYGRLFDVISIHAYHEASSSAATKLNAFKTILDGYPRREVWLTETNGSDSLPIAIEEFFVRGWLSKVFFYRMRGPSCGADPDPNRLTLLVNATTPCQSYNVLAYHMASQNQPAVHFAGTSGLVDHDDFVLLQNPHSVGTNATLRFATSAGGTLDRSYWLPANSRSTVHVRTDGFYGVEQAVTVFPQTPALPIWAEHADYWNQFQAGRLSQGSGERSDTWYFAEGATGGGFWIHDNTVYNPSPVFYANVTWKFLNSSGSTVSVSQVLPPRGHYRLRVNNVAGVEPEHGTIVSARWSGGQYHDLPAPIVAERTMSWGNNIEGHSSRGVPFASTQWYFAEGNEGSGWSTYIPIANPTSTPATVHVWYMTTSGLVGPWGYTIGGTSRITVPAAGAVSGSFGIIIKSVGTYPTPIVAERSMYQGAGFTVGHVTEGAPSPSQRWLMPEGTTEGGGYWQPFILLANPSPTAATVQLKFMKAGGGLVTDVISVPAGTRYTVIPANYAALQNTPFSTEAIVLSPGQDIVPASIIAERAVYWGNLTGGHSAMGLP